VIERAGSELGIQLHNNGERQWPKSSKARPPLSPADRRDWIGCGKALRQRGCLFKDAGVRVLGSTAILTAESRTVSSRSGKESQAHFRLIAVYIQESDAIRLVHFQSTLLREKGDPNTTV